MASNAASSVQFRVNGTEMARGRTRKTERSQSMDPRAKPRAAGRLKGKRRDNRDEREFILGPENAGNFCIARRSRGISAIVSRRLPRSRLLGRHHILPVNPQVSLINTSHLSLLIWLDVGIRDQHKKLTTREPSRKYHREPRPYWNQTLDERLPVSISGSNFRCQHSSCRGTHEPQKTYDAR